MRRCDNKVISGKTAQFNNCAVYFACLSRLFVPAVFSAVCFSEKLSQEQIPFHPVSEMQPVRGKLIISAFFISGTYSVIKDYCKQHGKQAFMWSWELENDTALDTDLGFTILKCNLCVESSSYLPFSYQAHIQSIVYLQHQEHYLCPACTAKRKALGLKTSDDLQFWFMNQIKDYCKLIEICFLSD